MVGPFQCMFHTTHIDCHSPKKIIKHLKNGDHIHLWCFEHPSASLPVYGIGLGSEESQWWRNTILPSIGCSKSLPLIDYYRLGLVMIFPYVPQALQESQALWESLASLVGCLLFSNPCWSQQHPLALIVQIVESTLLLSCHVKSDHLDTAVQCCPPADHLQFLPNLLVSANTKQ